MFCFDLFCLFPTECKPFPSLGEGLTVQIPARVPMTAELGHNFSYTELTYVSPTPCLPPTPLQRPCSCPALSWEPNSLIPAIWFALALTLAEPWNPDTVRTWTTKEFCSASSLSFCFLCKFGVWVGEVVWWAWMTGHLRFIWGWFPSVLAPPSANAPARILFQARLSRPHSVFCEELVFLRNLVDKSFLASPGLLAPQKSSYFFPGFLPWK